VRSVILGSVSRALAHSARCPLLVVPRPPAEDATKLWRNHTAQSALPFGVTRAFVGLVFSLGLVVVVVASAALFAMGATRCARTRFPSRWAT
jgi:hypothetical protein